MRTEMNAKNQGEMAGTADKPSFRRRMAGVAGDIFVSLLLCFGIYVVGAVLIRFLIFGGGEVEGDASFIAWMQVADEACLACSVLLSAWGMLWRRKRPFSYLGLSFRWREACAGLGWAVLLYAAGFGLSLALGVVRVEAVVWHFFVLMPMLLLFLLVAVAEEALVRGFVLGRMLDGGVNRFVALLLASLLFALMHGFNPHVSWLSLVNILLAGIVLGIPYLYTRNLSFSIAFHWFWNWIQGPVLGYSVSGNEAGESLFVLSLSESHLMNGGSFGFEGSLLCTILLLLTAIALLSHYGKRAYR